MCMDLNSYLIEHGNAVGLAREIGVPPPNLSEWRNGKRPVPVEHAVSIERITSGSITRQELRPNDFWRIWPDLAHLKPVDAA